MKLEPRFWRTKRVCVTGGTGFLGWQLVQQLLPVAAHVRILGLRPASAHLAAQLQGIDCVYGDVRDAAAVRQALHGCDVVFHTAGTVAAWGPALKQMHEIHAVGTRQILQALPAGARLVHTSSVAAVGASRGRQSLTETSPFELQHLKVDYVHAKKAAEEIVLAAAAKGIDAVVVNPAYLIGPQDYEGSVMGRFCLRFWKGKVPLIPPGGMNFVDVRDVALGHLLAAEQGRAGRRYILGGENLTMVQFAKRLAEVRGQSFWWRPRMPHLLQAAIAWYAERRAVRTGREPYPAMQHVRLNRYHWFYSHQRAAEELGYRPRAIGESLVDAHQWFCESGSLKPHQSTRTSEDGRFAERAAPVDSSAFRG